MTSMEIMASCQFSVVGDQISDRDGFVAMWAVTTRTKAAITISSKPTAISHMRVLQVGLLII